jgi:small nuclear ribonucleoprotein
MSVDMAVKVLDESLGKIVLIKLKGSKVIRGNLHGFDQHMNLLLDNSVELFDEGKSNEIGTIVVRGDNVVMISDQRNNFNGKVYPKAHSYKVP